MIEVATNHGLKFFAKLTEKYCSGGEQSEARNFIWSVFTRKV